MALLRSAKRGDRALSWSDWLFAYLIIWALPIPFGMIISGSAMVWRWPFETLGRAIPAETVVSVIFGFGVFLIMMPIFSWIGLLVSWPIVWMALRLGLGGWLSFLLGGILSATLASAALGGLTPEIPIVLGVLTALTLRWMLGERNPKIFVPGRPAGD